MTDIPAARELASIRAPFSDRLLLAVQYAREEALRYNHAYLGTEHLLLGLLRVTDGLAAKLLSLLGVNLDRTRSALEFMVSRGDRSVALADLSFLPRARQALALAVEEIQALGEHHAVGTEHLLFGIVRVNESVGAQLLRHFDVTLEHLNRAHQHFLASGPDAATLPRNQVISCRVSDRDLDAIDALVEAGIRSGRSDAAAWLISAGITGNPALFQRVYATVSEIRRLRGEAQAVAERLIAAPSDPA
jgi:ATP-dependent Clp protease ATP-binding subunit ClpC